MSSLVALARPYCELSCGRWRCRRLLGIPGAAQSCRSSSAQGRRAGSNATDSSSRRWTSRTRTGWKTVARAGAASTARSCASSPASRAASSPARCSTYRLPEACEPGLGPAVLRGADAAVVEGHRKVSHRLLAAPGLRKDGGHLVSRSGAGACRWLGAIAGRLPPVAPGLSRWLHARRDGV